MRRSDTYGLCRNVFWPMIPALVIYRCDPEFIDLRLEFGEFLYRDLADLASEI